MTHMNPTAISGPCSSKRLEAVPVEQLADEAVAEDARARGAEDEPPLAEEVQRARQVRRHEPHRDDVQRHAERPPDAVVALARGARRTFLMGTSAIFAPSRAQTAGTNRCMSP